MPFEILKNRYLYLMSVGGERVPFDAWDSTTAYRLGLKDEVPIHNFQHDLECVCGGFYSGLLLVESTTPLLWLGDNLFSRTSPIFLKPGRGALHTEFKEKIL